MDIDPSKLDELITLVYTSVATRPMSEQDLLDILQVSRRNNVGDDITGLLLYHHGSFMQVLEGPRANVEHTYQRIARDKRHHYIATILKQPIQKRCFGAWKMSFVNLSNPAVAETQPTAATCSTRWANPTCTVATAWPCRSSKRSAS